MRRLRAKWRKLSIRKRVAGAAAAPLVVVIVGGLFTQVALPWIKDLLEEDPAPRELRAELEKVTVDEGVTLAEYSARHQVAALAPRFELAALGSRAAALAYDEGLAQAAPDDRDGDGIADTQDSCPDQPAPGNGCPSPDPDGDGDGVKGGQDRCPGQAAPTADGCPTGDRDGDGVPDARDGCPDAAGDAATGCAGRPPSRILNEIRHDYDAGPCTTEFVAGGRRGGSCAPVADQLQMLVSGVDEEGQGPDQPGDAAARASAMLTVLHETRTRRSASGGPAAPLGATVSFEVTLKGFAGHGAEVRWSLYHASGGRVPRDWLVSRRVLRLRGEAETDTGSADFWVPMPKLPGPFFVRISVYDEKGGELTFARTRSFR